MMPDYVFVPLYLIQAFLCFFALVKVMRIRRPLVDMPTGTFVFIALLSTFSVVGWAWVIVALMYEGLDTLAVKWQDRSQKKDQIKQGDNEMTRRDAKDASI